MKPTTRGMVLLGALIAVLVVGCGDDDPPPPTTTVAPAGEVPALRVDLIDDAVAALEGELATKPVYYEINATPTLVNLFVASGDDEATAWVYVDGELSSEELAGAAGGSTFDADALDFDPETVLATVSAELPTTRQDVFEVVGGPDGAVRYTVVATSAAGGQLLITVAGDGSVIEVSAAETDAVRPVAAGATG